MWQFNLLRAMKDPVSRVYEDDLVVIIRDKYPKSSVHLLVLPTEDINDLTRLKKDHIELVRHMELKGREVIRGLAPGEPFKCGFHAMPSLARLHLHVLTTDFDSPCLKTKRHWNSFNSPYFVPTMDILNSLESCGYVKLPSKETCDNFLKKPLKCHPCSLEVPTMPALKKHLAAHSKGSARKEVDESSPL